MKKLTYLIIPMLLIINGCEEILMEDDISGEHVKLVAPVDAAQFNSTGITFTWEEIEYGTQYRIQIARPNFEAPLQIVTDNVTDTTSFTTQLNVGSYEWRVQGVNSGYATAFTTRSLTIVSNDDFENNSVTLTSPSNNLITNQPSQNLVWQPVLGATAYQLQIVNTTGNEIILEQEVSGTSYQSTFPEGNLSWKVRATNSSQNTLYSSRTILVDTTVPNTPVLSSPGNLSNSSDSEVTFQWTRSPIPGSAEKDSIYIYTNNELNDLEYKNQETSPYTTASLEEGTYFWYVKSFDAAGNTSSQSTVFSFTLN